MAAVAVVICLFLMAPAQDSPTPDSNAASAAASPAGSPTPIPFSELITQADQTNSTLKKIAAGAASDPTADAIESDLPPLSDEINARFVETADAISGPTSLEQLRSLETGWDSDTETLTKWISDLTTRAKGLEADLKRLDELAGSWKETLVGARNTETPPEVISRIEEVNRSITETRKTVESQRARIVALQNRVGDQQGRVGAASASIKEARAVLVGRLLVRDSPPIWSSELWARTGVLQAFRDSLATQLSGLQAFAARNADRLVIHFIVFIFLALGLYFLRRRAIRHVEANPELKQAAVIFYLPVSTALILAILLSSQFYTQMPQILGAIFGAVALVPTVIILRKLVERELYPVLYILVIFYFIDQLRVIAEDVPTIARPLFLAEMLAGFLFFLWIYRARLSKTEANDMKRGAIFRTMKIATLVALPFLAVSLLANTFGFVNLSALLGNAVLRSAYTAVIVYAAVRIVDGLIIFALRFRPLNLLKMVQGYRTEIQARARKIIRWIALLLWVYITLELLTLRDGVFGRIGATLTAELTVGSLSISAFDVLLFFAIVWVAFMLSRLIRFVLEEDVFPRLSLAPGIPYAISTILNYAILLVGFFFAVGAAGFDLTRFTVLVGAFGVGIGFGLQNIINNFVSGLILLFERPIKVGDEIMIDDATGTVRRIGIRASIIKQWDNSEIIVPNSKLISENVKNWTRTMRKRGIEIPIRVAHGTDTKLVTELLNKVAAENPLVAEKPAPQVLMDDFGAASLNFKLRAWTSNYDKAGAIASELAFAINKAFAENNVAAPQVTPNIPV